MCVYLSFVYCINSMPYGNVTISKWLIGGFSDSNANPMLALLAIRVCEKQDFVFVCNFFYLFFSKNQSERCIVLCAYYCIMKDREKINTTTPPRIIVPIPDMKNYMYYNRLAQL